RLTRGRATRQAAARPPAPQRAGAAERRASLRGRPSGRRDRAAGLLRARVDRRQLLGSVRSGRAAAALPACARGLVARRRPGRDRDRRPQPRQPDRRRDHPRPRPADALSHRDQRLHRLPAPWLQRVGDRPRRPGLLETMTTEMTTMHRSPTPYLLVLALISACETSSSTDEAADQTGDETGDEGPSLLEAELESGYPQLDDACRGPIAEPSHLVVTSTD